MKILGLITSLALIAALVPVTSGGGHTDVIGQPIQLAGIEGTGAPKKPQSCEMDDITTTACRPDADEEVIPGATDRGGHA